MATPKRRTTKAKSRQRAAHWKAEAPTYAECPQCHQPKLPHRVCGNCGHYAGRQAIEVE
jgi:large subunit ribosomal protein L32